MQSLIRLSDPVTQVVPLGFLASPPAPISSEYAGAKKLIPTRPNALLLRRRFIARLLVLNEIVED